MKNKIISILCIFILFSCLFINNNVFATDTVYNTLPEHISNVVTDESKIPETSNSDYRIFTFFSSNYGYFCLCVYNCSEDFSIKLNSGKWYVTGSANYNIYVINKDTGNIYDTTKAMSFQANHTDFYDSDAFYFKNIDIYNADGSIFFSGTGTNDSNTDVPDYDAWYDSIFNGISGWVGTLLEMLVNPFGAIADGIKNLGKSFSSTEGFLNPTSEDFFAYELVEILLDGLKGLFVPEDNYFSNYFNELNNWFSERLGFLYYPLELLFDLLNRMLNIDFKLPIINIPDIKEPTTNITLIKATTFNFNDLLENSVFSNVHNIYLLIVDAGIYIGLVSLLMKKYEEVLTK